MRNIESRNGFCIERGRGEIGWRERGNLTGVYGACVTANESGMQFRHRTASRGGRDSVGRISGRQAQAGAEQRDRVAVSTPLRCGRWRDGRTNWRTSWRTKGAPQSGNNEQHQSRKSDTCECQPAGSQGEPCNAPGEPYGGPRRDDHCARPRNGSCEAICIHSDSPFMVMNRDIQCVGRSVILIE